MRVQIRVVNPNTTAAMTALIGKGARAAAGPGVTVQAVNPPTGPPSIESHCDEALSVPGLLAEIDRGETEGVDGYVVACFGDPGLEAARELASGPVVGIAEAAMRTAPYLGRSFSVVTTLQRTVGHAWDLAETYGVRDRCAGIHACDIAVLDLERDPASYDRILQACRIALENDGSDVVVLGCAGMADLAVDLSVELGVPVVEGVAAATATVVGLVRLGLRTSTRGEYAAPERKPLGGPLPSPQSRGQWAKSARFRHATGGRG